MCARSTRWLVRAVLGAALSSWMAAPPAVAAQAARAGDELLFGHWNLIVAKSKYSPGPGPKSQRRTYEAHPEGVKTTVVTVHADGHSTSVEYVANYDSIQYPVTGSEQVDAIVLEKIDARTAGATLTHAGRTIGTARRVISEDGKTMTISFRDARALINNVAVYEKEEKSSR